MFGGSKFVGRAVVNRLVSEGHDVYVLNRGNNPTPDGSQQLIADRNNFGDLSKVLGNRDFDTVYDISAYTPEQTRLAINCLEGKTKHYLHISSASVYLESGEYPLTEDSPTGFNELWGDYGKEKYLCEQELLKSFQDHNFPMTIFRPFYIYGPGNNLDRESYIFRRILNRATVIIPGMGRPLIQFGHVNDLVDALLYVTGKSKAFGEIYNIGDSRAFSMQGWVETCGAVVGIEPKIKLVEAQTVGYSSRQWFPFRDVHLFGSSTKIYKHFGIASKFSLLEGLRDTFEKTKRQDLMEFTLASIEQSIEEM